jgi:hypothetical protein
MKTLPRSLPLCLAALALAFAPTAIRAQQVCQSIAGRIRTAEPPADRDDPWRSPVQVLARLPDATIRLDQGKSLTLEVATGQLKGELHASPRLIEEVTTLVGAGGYLRLRRFGSSELRAAEVSQGSAGCQNFVFFTSRGGGPADAVEPPSELSNRKDGSAPVCSGFGGLAFVAEAGGSPAFIVEEGRDLHERISVTPWHGGWQKSCEVLLDFTAELDVTERFCARGIDCAKASDQAKALVLRYDKDANAFADTSTLDDALKALQKRAEERQVGSREFPSFDQKPQYQAASFSETTVSVPVMLEGQALIAKIGHGSIGWRTYPDYLVGLYRPTGDDFEAVASVILTKKRAKPVAITVK